MKPRPTDEQITQMIKERGAGERTADMCRRYAISQGTLYTYKSKYGGMELLDSKRLRRLDDVNSRVEKLLAELMLDITTLWDVSSKKW